MKIDYAINTQDDFDYLKGQIESLPKAIKNNVIAATVFPVRSIKTNPINDKAINIPLNKDGSAPQIEIFINKIIVMYQGFNLIIPPSLNNYTIVFKDLLK